jgi:hypothetical protein
MSYCSSHFFFQHFARTKSRIIPLNQGREEVEFEKVPSIRSKIQKALEDKTLASRLRNKCIRLYDHGAMVTIRLLKRTKYVVKIGGGPHHGVQFIKCLVSCVRFIGFGFSNNSSMLSISGIDD